MTIVHHLDEATILSYAAGTLGEALSVAAACHISMCTECRAAVRKAEALGGEMLDDLEATAISDVRRAATYSAKASRGPPSGDAYRYPQRNRPSR